MELFEEDEGVPAAGMGRFEANGGFPLREWVGSGLTEGFLLREWSCLARTR
jgi:hypothetical protein